MIFWHMGAAAVIVYVTLGRSRIDYRWILAGAVLPDLVDGALSLGDFYSAVGIADPDDGRARGYHTVAGLVMHLLGRIPRAGDRAENAHLLFEVADMDGFRVDKVLVTRRSVAGSGDDPNL